MGRLHKDGVTTCLELGPGDVLAGMLGGCLPDTDRPLTALAMYRDWQALRAGADMPR